MNTTTTKANDAYRVFLERKTHLGNRSGFEPLFMPDFLFPFQRFLTEWAARKGRGAMFADCGLGKGPMGLVFAQNVVEKTCKPVLFLTPLAVGHQIVTEGEKFGIECKQSRDGKIAAPITVTNYQQLHKFDWQKFGGVVADESGILKNHDGAIREAVTEFMRKLPYRLLCTATAAPNDYIEFGNSSEALGDLGFVDMVARFFKKAEKTMSRKDEYRAGLYRFRGHAERDFWRWICSWARAVRRPSDLGFPNDGYELPPLITTEHVVTARTPNPDFLFDMPAVGLSEQRSERRRTIDERCEMAARLIFANNGPSIAWCHLNDEGDSLERMIPNSRQISGRTSDDEQEEIIQWFIAGERSESRRLIGKPQQIGYGLNLQICSHQTFFPSHSFEQFYQSIRRSWRFGQKNPVHIDMISSEGEAGVLASLKRKAGQADKMFERLVELINNELRIEKQHLHTKQPSLPSWL